MVGLGSIRTPFDRAMNAKSCCRTSRNSRLGSGADDGSGGWTVDVEVFIAIAIDAAVARLCVNSRPLCYRHGRRNRYRLPHAGQSACREMAVVNVVIARRSSVSSRPSKGSPNPASHLMASMAASEPSVAETAPNTGN